MSQKDQKKKKKKSKVFQMDSLFSLHNFFFLKLGEIFNLFTNNLLSVAAAKGTCLSVISDRQFFLFSFFFFLGDTLFCLFTYLFIYLFIYLLFSFMCILSLGFRTPQA